MKKVIYTAVLSSLLSSTFMCLEAQTWRPKNAGLPSGFNAKSVYGEGAMILVANTSAFSGSQMYYTPDTSTALSASPSTLGAYSAMESAIVKCMGLQFAAGIGGVFKSHDNGHTWVAAGAAGATYALYSCNDTLYASLGAGLGVAKMSTDTGNTWLDIHYTGALTTCFVKANGILYVGSTGGITYTADNGTTWNTVTTTALRGTSIVGLAAFGGNVYCACSTGVYKTTDNGVTWTRVLAQSMFCLAAVDTSLFGGTATSGIYRSDNTGTNWVQINTGLPYTGSAAYTTVNFISYNDYYLIASVQGDSAIYVTSLADMGLNPSPATTRVPAIHQNTSFSLYPNPAGNSVIVKMNDATGTSLVNIYDLTGKNVKTISSNRQTTVTVDLADVPAGVYFVAVGQGYERSVKNLVIIKQ